MDAGAPRVNWALTALKHALSSFLSPAGFWPHLPAASSSVALRSNCATGSHRAAVNCDTSLRRCCFSSAMHSSPSTRPSLGSSRTLREMYTRLFSENSAESLTPPPAAGGPATRS